MVSCFRRENNERDGQITWGGGGGGFNPDPTTMCGDKKGVVPRFEIVKSPLVSD